MPRRFILPLFSALIVGSLTLAGCGSLRNEVNPELLDRQASKLVVTGFLSPQDTVLAVKVTRSQTVLGDTTVYDSLNNPARNIPGATVTISNGSQTVALSTKNNYYNSAGDYYSVDARQLPILAGRTYTLTVQMPTGERAQATCTIPQPVPILSVSFDSTIVNQILRQRQRYFIRALWSDPAGQANYYQLTGTLRYVNAIQNPGGRTEFRSLRFDSNVSSLQTDIGTDGTDMVSERAYVNNRSENFSSLYRSATVTVNLLTTDQAYYQYQYAIGRQASASGNPFAEPVLIPSNVQGALGCFAGYNRSTVVLRLK